MRKIFTIIATMLLWTASMFAQAPQKMAYQALVRDADGQVVTNQELGVQVSILQGTVDGASVYSESHTTTTTSAGAINLVIGGGKSTDDFSAIDWSKGPFFVQSTTEVNGKSVTVTSQLLSVPYALYAEKANSVDENVLRAMVLQVLADSGYVAGGNGGSSEPSVTPIDKTGGKLPGRFSVSAAKQISFAMGNLQYQASTDTWRFAENQYDVIGEDNKNISSSYSGWIDLFGWGTSGYNSKYPYMTSTDYSKYGDGENDIAGTDYDWGVYNAISNGGNKAGMWRTLTYDEWYYLFSTRTNAKNLRGQATVNGQTGYVLLPDGWSTPSGMTFTADPGDFTTNSYSAAEWCKMEAAGALFLPCAGGRSGTGVNGVGSYGGCWSSAAGSNGDAGGFYFGSVNAFVGYSNRSDGYSVRLAREITE